MARFETAQLTEAYRTPCEDRIAVIHHDDRTVIVVADGAGGVGSGDLAAETVVREIANEHPGISTAKDWERGLRQLDGRIGTGESTAVVVDLRPDSIIGASVGDSGAWVVYDDQLVDLTANQNRKPLLGSGAARPTPFSHGPLRGTLIVATDGFWNYVRRDALTCMFAETDLSEIPRRCVELVRLPSGDLWDDVAVVACRPRRPRRAQERYTLTG